MSECQTLKASTQLPLSFMASVFGMNARELNSGVIPLSTEFKYMCEQCPVR
jgi:hypothetical protein